MTTSIHGSGKIFTSLMNRYASTHVGKTGQRLDMFISDYRLLSPSDHRAAEILVGYSKSQEEPSTKEVIGFVRSLSTSLTPLKESSVVFEDATRSLGAVSVVVKHCAEYRPVKDREGMTEIVAKSMYLDSEGSTWSVEASEEGAHRLVRAEGDDLVDILESRLKQVRMPREGLTFAKLASKELVAGRSTLAIGDTVKFYYDGKIFKDGVIESLIGNAVVVSHPAYPNSLNMTTDAIIDVSHESSESLMSRKMERTDYFQQAYGYNPADTDKLTTTRQASVITAEKNKRLDVAGLMQSEEWRDFCDAGAFDSLDSSDESIRYVSKIFKRFFPPGWLKKNFAISKKNRIRGGRKSFILNEINHYRETPPSYSIMLNSDGTWVVGTRSATTSLKSSAAAELKRTRRELERQTFRLAELRGPEKTETAKTVKRLSARVNELRASLKTATVQVTAHDFSEQDQVKLTQDFNIGSRQLPAGTVGSIARVINYGKPNEVYVVQFGQDTTQISSANAVDVLQKVAGTSYRENSISPAVSSVQQAKVLAKSFVQRSLSANTRMDTMEVWRGSGASGSTTFVNVNVPNVGWRKLAITAEAVEDISTVKVGGARTRITRASLETLSN